MKGDFTRSPFAPEKHYSRVLLQQGRVTLDADWNEAQDITAHRIETEALDVIGASGAPLHQAGFHIVADTSGLTLDEKLLPGNQNPPAGPSLLVSAGRYYVDGVLAQNEHIVAIGQQDDLPPKGTTPLGVGTLLAYLDVWQRHITALDDDLLREKALGGPDTATRSKTVWQVRLLDVPAGTGCTTPLEAWNALTAPSSARLEARARPAESNEPCSIAPGGGYRRIENQLYRVEIHDAGVLGSATFKWSRDNGSVVTRWLGKGAGANDLLVENAGRDAVQRFASGQWVELVDDERELAGRPGVLVRLANAVGNTLTMEDPTVAGNAFPVGAIVFANFHGNPKVRRWESAGPLTVAVNRQGSMLVDDGFLELEDGVQVRFADDPAPRYRSSDYWLIPARTAIGSVEWPFTSPQPPSGITHHLARLAIVTVSAGGGVTLQDCRHVFAPLTEIDSGGDLKKHNRMLHGWGVVCGLKVHCVQARTDVGIEPGYAIACDGTDIDVTTEQRFGVVERAKALQLLGDDGTGDVCLTLASLPGKSFALDVTADLDAGKSFLERVLEGTLAKAVFDECIQPLIDLFNKHLVDDPKKKMPLAGEGTRNRAALFNLLATTAKAGDADMYLSRDEDKRLEALYQTLNEAIDSSTWCAIRDGQSGLLPMAYPPGLDRLGMKTSYGKLAHRGLRVHSERGLAYAFGATQSGQLHIFQLDEGDGELVAVINLTPPNTTVTVQDIAVWAKGIVVAVATATDSYLYFLDPTGQDMAQGPVLLAGKLIVRLQTPDEADRGLVCAIVKGQGLFQFEPANFERGAFDVPLAKFNATGPFAISGSLRRGSSLVVAALSSTTAVAPAYDQLQVLRFESGQLRIGFAAPLLDMKRNPATSSDDFGLWAFDGPSSGLLHVPVAAAAGTTLKRLLVLRPEGNLLETQAEMTLPTEGAVAIAVTVGFTTLALEDESRWIWFPTKDPVLNPALELPLQIDPSAIAIVGTPNGPTEYLVLNRGSKTLTRIPADQVTAHSAFEPKVLADYAAATRKAFVDAFNRLFEGLKDCACNQLLARCPTCGENDVLVIAKVEIRANQVARICNLQRREVVTFPKLFHWLSAIPLLPLLRELIELACCRELLAPAQADKLGADGLKLRTFGKLLAYTDTTSLSGLMTQVTSRFAASTTLLGNTLTGLVTNQATRTIRERVAIDPTVVTAVPPGDATEYLKTVGIGVAAVLPVDEALQRDGLRSLLDLPLALKSGEQVDLYVQNGKVAFFRRSTVRDATLTAATRNSSLADVVTRDGPLAAVTPDDLAAFRTEIAQAQADQIGALAKRDAEIGALRAELDALKKLVGDKG